MACGDARDQSMMYHEAKEVFKKEISEDISKVATELAKETVKKILKTKRAIAIKVTNETKYILNHASVYFLRSG